MKVFVICSTYMLLHTVMNQNFLVAIMEYLLVLVSMD
jgi:hypothetical protein